MPHIEKIRKLGVEYFSSVANFAKMLQETQPEFESFKKIYETKHGNLSVIIDYRSKCERKQFERKELMKKIFENKHGNLSMNKQIADRSEFARKDLIKKIGENKHGTLFMDEQIAMCDLIEKYIRSAYPDWKIHILADNRVDTKFVVIEETMVMEETSREMRKRLDIYAPKSKMSDLPGITKDRIVNDGIGKLKELYFGNIYVKPGAEHQSSQCDCPSTYACYYALCLVNGRDLNEEIPKNIRQLISNTIENGNVEMAQFENESLSSETSDSWDTSILLSDTYHMYKSGSSSDTFDSSKSSSDSVSSEANQQTGVDLESSMSTMKLSSLNNECAGTAVDELSADLSPAEKQDIANRFNDFLKDCKAFEKAVVVWNSKCCSWMFLNYNTTEKKINIFSSDKDFVKRFRENVTVIGEGDKKAIAKHFKDVMKVSTTHDVMAQSNKYNSDIFRPENPKNQFVYALAYGLRLAMDKEITTSEWQPSETEDTVFIANIIAQVLHHRKLPRADIWQHLSDPNIFD